MHGNGPGDVVRAIVAVALVVVSLAAAPPADAAGAGQVVQRSDRDWDVPITEVPGTDAVGGEDVLDGDPHRLIPKKAFVQRYSLDVDNFEVWLCGSVVNDMATVIAQLEAASVDYFAALSDGRYTPSFTAGGSIPDDASCMPEFLADSPSYTPAGSPEALLVVDSVTGGGYASPGSVCGGSSIDCPGIPSTFPGNGRYAIVGESALFNFPSVAIHEIGHTLQWPHSHSGLSSYEYDNPIDLMSGNSANLGTPSYTEPLPYATSSYNRYQSGWVDPADVVVAQGNPLTVTLEPFGVAGTQLIAVETGVDGQFYVLGARKRSTYDPIPAAWEGVEVYFVDHDCGQPVFGSVCPGLFREHYQEPPNEYQLDHVMTPGDNMVLAGVEVAVTAATATGFVLAINGGVAAGTFIDDDGSIFEDDIEWLYSAGITTGCNPPVNNSYCPDKPVTRGQMAAFLVRALGLASASGDRFVDDDGSTFEDDIERLAEAGITAGCNPPANDMYCPDKPVTRGQMAAFLRRALSPAS
ncbi:MAG: S-layer homology domain-containing protein [Acidimicrobiia bacterium]|nr:S-layer homology domain-containing protein [Acidimicrobiia bacterium]